MALGEILSFEAWLAGPGRTTATWPADRQRKAYNSYVAAQQKYLAGKQGYEQELGAYREAYKGSTEHQREADISFKRTHVAKVSASKNLRRDVNDWYFSKSRRKNTFPEGTDLELTTGESAIVQELAQWGAMFKWLKAASASVKEFKGRYGRDLNEYNGMINYGNGSPMETWSRARIGAVAEAPEKVKRYAPGVWGKISKAIAARSDLEPEFYDAAVKETRQRAIATGRARPAGTGPGSGTPGPGASTGGATVGGFSLVTILIILAVVALVGYGIYVATQ